MTKRIHIDIETYCELDLAECGTYRYASDPSFRILLLAYATDDEPVQIVDLASGEPLPWWLERALQDPFYVKCAHNAAFERVCLTWWLRRQDKLREDVWLDPSQWECSMVKSVSAGLPASLKQVGEALQLEEGKMTEGRRLITIFCTPHAKGAGLFGHDDGRIRPEDKPDDWQTFRAYCMRDVEVEREIGRQLAWLRPTDFERELYALDQRINDRGVRVDLTFARHAAEIGAEVMEGNLREAAALTGLDNPNSVPQLKRWLEERTGMKMETLRKTDLADLKARVPADVARVIELRAEMGKTSNAKYDAMLSVTCTDGRARGLTQFYGSRTGRWAGRLIQLQNLPQNHLPLSELAVARQLVREGDAESLALCFGNVPDTLSQLIRTALVPAEGKTFAVCDFSAVEARVLAWLAGEQWVLDVFRQGGDIYCATASQMFHKRVEKHGENAELRQKGKIAVLALGYGGGVNALDKMGGQRLGMTTDEEADTVSRWRKSCPGIVNFWGMLEKAARMCVTFRQRQVAGRFVFEMQDGTLTVKLPSGRLLCYRDMEIYFEQPWAYLDQTDKQAAANSNYISKERKDKHLERYWNDRDGRLRFMSLNQTTKKWEWTETFGGKLAENVTQAVARDCRAEVLVRLEAEGLRSVFHVHDEVICEVAYPEQLEDVEKAFSIAPEWAKDLPLVGAGYNCNYYYKD